MADLLRSLWLETKNSLPLLGVRDVLSTTRERPREMCVDFIINYDYCSHELLCFWMHAESPIATAWYFHYSFLFKAANNEIKTSWGNRRKEKRKKSSGSRNKISAKSDTEKVFLPWKRWSTYQTVFQIYHTQIHDAHKNIKISSIEFYIFHRFSESFLFLPCFMTFALLESRLEIAKK